MSRTVIDVRMFQVKPVVKFALVTCVSGLIGWWVIRALSGVVKHARDFLAAQAEKLRRAAHALCGCVRSLRRLPRRRYGKYGDPDLTGTTLAMYGKHHKTRTVENQATARRRHPRAPEAQQLQKTVSQPFHPLPRKADFRPSASGHRLLEMTTVTLKNEASAIQEYSFA